MAAPERFQWHSFLRPPHPHFFPGAKRAPLASKPAGCLVRCTPSLIGNGLVQVEKEDMLETIRDLNRQLKLKSLVLANFVPADGAAQVEQRAVWNEEREDWDLPRLEVGPSAQPSRAAPQSARGGAGGSPRWCPVNHMFLVVVVVVVLAAAVGGGGPCGRCYGFLYTQEPRAYAPPLTALELFHLPVYFYPLMPPIPAGKRLPGTQSGPGAR